MAGNITVWREILLYGGKYYCMAGNTTVRRETFKGEKVCNVAVVGEFMIPPMHDKRQCAKVFFGKS